MNTDEVYQIIKEVATKRARRDKETIIKLNIGDPEFVRVLRYAYDPFVTYGVTPKSIDLSADSDLIAGPFAESTWKLLDALATRELTGNAAITALSDEAAELTPESFDVLCWILEKDVHAGFTASTINKVKKGTIPSFDCMLAKPFEDKRIKKWPQFVEPKLDGVRVMAIITPGAENEEPDVKFVSRTGKEFTSFNHLKDVVVEQMGRAYAKVWADEDWWDGSGLIIDGEMISGSFNDTVSSVRKKDVEATDAEFHVFDVITIDAFKEGKWSKPYAERRKIVAALKTECGKIKPVPHYMVSSLSEIHTIYASVRERGLEGLIVKSPNHAYQAKRSFDWMKIKNEATEDLTVIGAFEGTGKYVGKLGGLIVDRNGVEVRVGGGLSDAQRDEFWEAYLRDCNKMQAVSGESTVYDVGCGLLGRLVEVEYHEVTPDGSLRHPRFVRFRDDKDHAGQW